MGRAQVQVSDGYEDAEFEVSFNTPGKNGVLEDDAINVYVVVLGHEIDVTSEVDQWLNFWKLVTKAIGKALKGKARFDSDENWNVFIEDIHGDVCKKAAKR